MPIDLNDGFTSQILNESFALIERTEKSKEILKEVNEKAEAWKLNAEEKAALLYVKVSKNWHPDVHSILKLRDAITFIFTGKRTPPAETEEDIHKRSQERQRREEKDKSSRVSIMDYYGEGGMVRVQGYGRGGSEVRAHARTRPDGDETNNLSYRAEKKPA